MQNSDNSEHQQGEKKSRRFRHRPRPAAADRPQQQSDPSAEQLTAAGTSQVGIKPTPKLRVKAHAFTPKKNHSSSTPSMSNTSTPTSKKQPTTKAKRFVKQRHSSNSSNSSNSNNSSNGIHYSHNHNHSHPVAPTRDPSQAYLPKIYKPHVDTKAVERQMATGMLVRGVLRVNGKQNTDAYVSLDESPNASALKIYPKLADYDVGSGNDIYICGNVSRNRAISGDVVAVRILTSKEAKQEYRIHKSLDDKRKDRQRKQRKERSDTMAAMVDEHLAYLGGHEGELPDNSDAGPPKEEEGRKLPEVFGAIVAVLSRSKHRQFTGKLSATEPKSVAKYKLFLRSLGQPILWFKPADDAMPLMAVLQQNVPQSLYSRNSTHLCTVTMRKWPATSPVPFADFEADLGVQGSIEVDTKLILAENGVATEEFKPDVLRCLPKTPWCIPADELSKRTDLRSECIFTIDPPTARDLDDAVSCRVLPSGNVLIGVHIADVSYFVRPRSALDREARQRATTTYMVQRAYPMLPSLLCEELCSLNPGVDRLAFSVMWEMDPETATVKSTWFGRTVISSACKLAYDDAQNVIDGNTLPSSISVTEFKHGKAKKASAHRRALVESSILWFYKLSKIMRKRRFDTGALSLNSVKLSFELNDSGMPVSCEPYKIKDSNRLIEEFMLLANMSVAARIEHTFPDAALLRRHSPPLQRRLEATCEMLQKSGISIDPASAHDIQASLESIADPDTRATVENILTGPMQRALYFSTHSIENRSGYRHYALNVPLYTHFTSPIRRYADVIVHRTLEASLACFGNHVVGDHPLLPHYLSSYFPDTPAEGSMTVSRNVAESLLIPDSVQIAQIANHCNQRRDAAKKAQDASSDLYLVHYLDNVGKNITTPGVLSLGVVTKIGQNGIDVLVPMFGIEETIFMDRMADKKDQVIATDGRQWKLIVWKMEPAQVTLVWQAKPLLSADVLTDNLSALVIDDTRHAIEGFGRTLHEDSTTMHIRLFDKVTVSVLPSLKPISLSLKLAMPSLYDA